MDAALFPPFVTAAGQPAGDGTAAAAPPGPAGELFGAALATALERPSAAPAAPGATPTERSGGAVPLPVPGRPADDPASAPVLWFNPVACALVWQPDAARPPASLDLGAVTSPLADPLEDQTVAGDEQTEPPSPFSCAHPGVPGDPTALPGSVDVIPLDTSGREPGSTDEPPPDHGAGARDREEDAPPAPRIGLPETARPDGLPVLPVAVPGTMGIEPVRVDRQPVPAGDPAAHLAAPAGSGASRRDTDSAARTPAAGDLPTSGALAAGVVPATQGRDHLGPAQEAAGPAWEPQGIEAEPPLRAPLPGARLADAPAPHAHDVRARESNVDVNLPTREAESGRRPLTVEELVRAALRGAAVETARPERIPLGAPLPANLNATLQTDAARDLFASATALRETLLRQAADRPVPAAAAEPAAFGTTRARPAPSSGQQADASGEPPAADPLPARPVRDGAWTPADNETAGLSGRTAAPSTGQDGGARSGSGEPQPRPRPQTHTSVSADAAVYAAGTRMSGAELASRVSELAQRPAVATPAPPPQEPTANGEPLSHAVVRSLKFQWAQGGGEARLQLRPEYLGDLSVSLRVSGASVTAILSAESASVRAWIDTHQSDLRRALEAQGLSLDSLIIDPDGHPQERQESPGRQEHRAPHRRRHPDAGRFEALL